MDDCVVGQIDDSDMMILIVETRRLRYDIRKRLNHIDFHVRVLLGAEGFALFLIEDILHPLEPHHVVRVRAREAEQAEAALQHLEAHEIGEALVLLHIILIVLFRDNVFQVLVSIKDIFIPGSATDIAMQLNNSPLHGQIGQPDFVRHDPNRIARGIELLSYLQQIVIIGGIYMPKIPALQQVHVGLQAIGLVALTIIGPSVTFPLGGLDVLLNIGIDGLMPHTVATDVLTDDLQIAVLEQDIIASPHGTFGRGHAGNLGAGGMVTQQGLELLLIDILDNGQQQVPPQRESG